MSSFVQNLNLASQEASDSRPPATTVRHTLKGEIPIIRRQVALLSLSLRHFAQKTLMTNFTATKKPCHGFQTWCYPSFLSKNSCARKFGRCFRSLGCVAESCVSTSPLLDCRTFPMHMPASAPKLPQPHKKQYSIILIIKTFNYWYFSASWKHDSVFPKLLGLSYS